MCNTFGDGGHFEGYANVKLQTLTIEKVLAGGGGA